MTRVVKGLRQVAGVDKVKVEDFKKGHVRVVPEAGKRPSPRAVWDKVADIGFTPTKLVTPDGTYTKRPPGRSAKR